MTGSVEPKTLVPIFSPQLLNEINLVTKRPKLQKHFSQRKVQELLELVNIIGLCIETKSKINICRDTKDNHLLALAKDIAFLIHKRYIPDPEQLNQQRFNCAAQMREPLYFSNNF